MSWMAQTLVSVTALMALVMAVRQPIARAFGPRIAYALWALPAIRMVLPPLPGHRQLFMPVMRIVPAEQGPSMIGLAPADAVIDPVVLPQPIVQASFASTIDWPLLILGVWAAGAIAFFAWQMIRYRLFVARALDGASLLSVEADVQIWTSPWISAPVASGIVRRRIFLPIDFLTRFSSPERRQALLHEGAHHDRKDILANLGAIAVLAAHWWNPVAHIAYRAFRADQELACDATVLDGATAEARYAYGSALVKAGGVRMPTAACALDNGTEIKRRLTMMKQGRIALGRRAVGLLVTALAIGGGCVATASGSYAARVAATIVPPSPPPAPEPIEAAAMPAPPAPPAPPPATSIVRHRDGKRTTTMVTVVEAGPATPTAAMPRAPSVPSAPAVANAPPVQPVPPAQRGTFVISRRDGRTVVTRIAPAPDARDEAETRALAEQARIQADVARQAALRAAEAGRIAGAEGRRAGEQARRAAEAQGRLAAANGRDIAQVSIDAARAGMVQQCAQAGHPVAPGERDWSKLATCNKAVVIAALQNARAEIARNRDMGDAEQAMALASIDRAISGMRNGRDR